MLRAALAVVLATALVGASLPAVEAARIDHANGVVRGEVGALERTLRVLATTDEPVAPTTPGARRLLTLRLPTRSWTDARLVSLAVGGAPPGTPPVDDPAGSDVVVWRVAGGDRRVVRVPGVDVGGWRNGTVADDAPLVVREAGPVAVTARLVRHDGRAVVLVDRPRA